MTGRPRPVGASRASDRLRRLLVLVPYLVKHPGTELSEIRRASCRERVLYTV